MFTRDEARAIVDRVLAASPARATELILRGRELRHLRLAESAPSEQNVVSDPSLQVRVEHEGRYGRASTSLLDDAAIERVLDAAYRAAKLSPPLDLPPLAAGAAHDDSNSDGGVDEAAARSLLARDSATKLEALAPALRAVAEAGAAATGFWDTTVESCTYATSAGCFRHTWLARDWFSSTVLAGDGGAGVAHDGQLDASMLVASRADAVVRQALDLALRSKKARAIEAREQRVLLAPQAVGELLLFLSWSGFGARNWLEERSFLRRRRDEVVLDPSISILDDAAAFGGLGFDFEGQDRRRVTLIDEGLARLPVFDRPTAKEARASTGLDVETSGHAGLQPSADGPLPRHLRFVVADAKQTPARELEACLGDGLIITQFHYTNLIDPTAVTVTGMTRNGTFLVEGGRVVAPVRNLRFTVDILDVLSTIEAASIETQVVEAFFGGAAMSVPSLVLPRFRFTSTQS